MKDKEYSTFTDRWYDANRQNLNHYFEPLYNKTQLL